MNSTQSNTEPNAWKTGAPFSRKRNRCSSYGSLSCSGSLPYSCVCDLSGVAASLCTSSHRRSLYTGFSLWTTMYGGYQFTSLIWWLCLIYIPTYMQNVWRDTSQSRRRVMHFQTWQHNAVVKDDGGAVVLTRSSGKHLISSDELLVSSLAPLGFVENISTGKMLVTQGNWVSRCPAEVGGQRTTDGTRH